MSRSNINLEDLETFIATADACSFSLAATRLSISQPTVTARIKKLEECFDAPLFERTTRRVETTPAGERLREHAGALLLQLKRLREELRGEAALTRGTLSIGATPALAALTLPPLVARLTRAHPGISVRIRDEHRSQTLADLSVGIIDVAVLGECASTAEFEFEPLFAIDFHVIGPAAHELSRHKTIEYHDLARYPLLTMPRSDSIWELVAAEFKRLGLVFHGAFEANSMFTVLQMVDAGLGLTILPSIALSVLDRSRYMAVKLGGSQKLSRKVGLVRVRGREFSPSAMVFRQCARKWARDQVGLPASLYRSVASASKSTGLGKPQLQDAH